MEAPAPRTPPLDPSKCHSTVETMRCSRCAMSAETVSQNGRDVSADDARAGGMVKFGHNLYYCDRCAKILHGSSGKVRASLLPHQREQQNTRSPQRQERWSIIPATSICTTAGTLEHHTCHLDMHNGRNVGASYLPPRYAQRQERWSIIPATSICTTMHNGRNVGASYLPPRYAQRQER
ncbi:hypothetical protein VC83_08246 [Pseudogymnoascus destructans]|uniref:Uncharacterized protein n=1 Tax=Pseudogymnoascus destructans TaxID=655981 RepID=A0A177A2N5_9PEZI|nr:uncharacterized protein VC83_08246 [Pseudogymnoascus destructans]OAF55353.1 hypothetical protein VC83_08246 [Pseudogymnoascus destructans]